ncbi:MAG: chromate transporter [Candidatus Brocadiia bacterium]
MMPRSDAEHEGGQSGARVPCVSIFWAFFRIGLSTLGGGLAMAAVMRHELVLRRRWIGEDTFFAEMSTASVVPGAIAVNIAYLQGRRLRGKRGAATAVLATILPSFCTIVVVAWVALPYFGHPKVGAFLHGCAIGVVGQLAFAGFVFGRRLLRSGWSVAVCAVAVAVVGGLGVHPIWGVALAAGLGYLASGRSRPGARSDPAE